MELNKLLASQVPLLVPAENCMKPYNNMKDEFHFEASSSSKGNSNNNNYHYLQDFHHLDHQFHVNVGSSSNPMFGFQNPCLDPYNDTSYTYEGSTTGNGNFYECKPLNAEITVGHGQVLDNFQGGNFQNGNFQSGNFPIGSSGYLNYPTHHRSNIPLDHHLMGSSHRGATNFLPLDCQDIKPMSFVVPDEVSCINNADQNGYYRKFGMSGKSRVTTVTSGSSTYKGQKKSRVVKGQWAIEEDRLLIQLVEQYGVRKWSHIAQMLPGRIGKQCRERWHNHLRPDIKKDTWSEEEDKTLIQAHAEIGNKWAEIAKRLPGRTENSIKNHWNATKRRQYSKRKCRSKYPRGSLLQEYIKSLNLDSASNSTGRQRRNNSANNNNATSPNNITSSTTAPTHQTQSNVGLSCANDRLVPSYDFNEDPEFCFDDNIFQEGCSIDSLLEDIPSAPVLLGEKYGNFDSKMPYAANGVGQNGFDGKTMPQASSVDADDGKDFDEIDMQVMESAEVKKEMDLVEMISQVNHI